MCRFNNKSKRWVKGQPLQFLKGHTDKVKQKTFLELGKCICGDPKCTIPYGLCHCGCKEKSPISKKTWKGRNAIKGEPARFIEGHAARITPIIEDAVPFKIDGVYCRLIPLTQGMYAIVDEADYVWLMQWKWCVYKSANECCTYYAVRNSPNDNFSHHPIPMHRFILGLEYGDVDQADHINCFNTLDNRRANLRISDTTEQACNKRKNSTNTSGYKRVSWDKERGKWVAVIGFRRKTIFLGRFERKEDAYSAYCEAAKLYHGEFSRV
jgi:hypothetical protein